MKAATYRVLGSLAPAKRRLDLTVCAHLGLMALASSCGWSMAEPTDVIEISEQLPITDRSSWSGALVNESFGLGSYKVTDVDRKWSSSTSSTSFFGSDTSKTTGGYAFALLDGGDKLRGECATEQHEKGHKLTGGAEFSNMVAKLGCRCNDEGSAATLTLEASTTNQYEGALVAPDVDYKVSALTQRTKGWTSHDPLGYRVDSASGPIGAVDLKKPGRVWISRAVEGTTRKQLACLFAGLLLYQPPTDR